MKKFKRGERGLIWIAAYILLKGTLLLALAIGFLHFLGKDVDIIVGDWLASVGVDLENHFIASLLEKLDLIDDHQIKMFSGVTFILATVFIAQGVGLLMKMRWAEYFTAIVTGLFIPMEGYELFRNFGFGKVMLLAINVAILWFLIVTLRRQARERRLDATALYPLAGQAGQ